MKSKSARIAVSLPSDLLRAVERARRTRKATRSGVVQEALKHWLDQQETRKLVEQYEAGYRRSPEEAGGALGAERWSDEALASEDW